jgi:hypothetical protein
MSVNVIFVDLYLQSIAIFIVTLVTLDFCLLLEVDEKGKG